MPLEIAFIPVRPDRAADFRAAARQSIADLFPRADGFIRGEVRRGVENVDTFALLLEWESVAHHTDGFVKSDLFEEWSRRTAGMVSGDPVVEHWVL